MLLEGTTTVEVKSGYGLDTESEMKMLRAVHNVSKQVPIKVVCTFMGAYGIGTEHKDAESACACVCEEVMRELATSQRKGEVSVSMVDVLLENGFFNPKQTEKILTAGKDLNLLGNIHGDEHTDQGAGTLARKCDNTIAVSHLERVSKESISDLSESRVAAVMLPATCFFLRLPSPPVREMIDRDVPIALGSDFNPNVYVLSMPLVMNLACVMFRMSMEEALVAATINAAGSIAVANEVGSIEVGKKANFILLNTETWEHLIFLGMGGMSSTPVGSNLDGHSNQNASNVIDCIYIEGKETVRNGKRVD